MQLVRTAARRFLRIRGRMDKPFKSIEEQIALLSSRGMSVSESAEEVLLREGYYSIINGYKDPFIDRAASRGEGHDVYKSGISFDDVHSLFTFDRNLRMILFQRFFLAEETLKNVCAYRFSEAHRGETEPYLNPNNYDAPPHQISKLISRLDTAIGRNPKKQLMRKPYLDHYIRNHDEVPIWVLMKYLTLGEAFKFYCFQPEGMQNAIAKTFSELYAKSHVRQIRITPRRLRLAYDHIKDFRNICAHDERLYCARVAPSHDTTIAKMLKDIELVISKEEYIDLIEDITRLVLSISRRLKPNEVELVLSSMGIKSVDDILEIAE